MARFKATDIADGSNWVIKNYIPKEVNNMEALGMTLEDLACKQVLLHSAACSIAQWCAKTAPPEFGESSDTQKFVLDFWMMSH